MQPTFRFGVSKRLAVCLLGGAGALVCCGRAWSQDAPDTRNAGPLLSSPKAQKTPATVQADEPASAQTIANLPPVPVYDKTIFGDTIPAAQLAFLKSFEGNQTRDLYNDKQFKALRKFTLPKWEFHYGRDMSIAEAMDAALGSSRESVLVRDGRFVTLSGTSGLFPGLQGRGFMWIDMQDGIVLSAFYFRPTNGEPTPTTTVFTRQLAVDAISMSQLPPDFFEDFSQWSADERISPITTRYFIGAENKRLLLEHDEDFCAARVAPPGSDCLQMTADAADVDMNTAYYLDQVHYATNATAYMLVGSDQTAFLRLRTAQCGSVADPIACRIRLTREQIHVIARPAPRPRR